MQRTGNKISVKTKKDGPQSRPSFFISLKKINYVQNSSPTQQVPIAEFYQKKTGFGQSHQMAKSRHRLPLLCNYKSIRTLISYY